MTFIKDKLLLLLVSLSVFWYFTDSVSIAPLLCVVSLSGLNTYWNHLYYRYFSVFIYILFCGINKEFLYFSPLILYDVAENKESRPLYLLIGICLLASLAFNYSTLPELIPICLIYLISVYLKSKSTKLHNLYLLHYQSKNQLEDTASFLEQKNKALLEKQDSEIHIATLNERNRIAREIHDNVGHLLSRCLLQIGALMVIAKKDEMLYNGLGQIKETLTSAMNSIRTSVHDLHDESLDLKTELTKLTEAFSFCHVNFEYDLTSEPNHEVKYSFIAIVKEALANVIKHSHATEVEITLKEHPAFYQLIIRDNDLKTSSISSSGIGLYNMHQRITSLNGQFSVDTTKGFKIFITVPKKKGN